MKRIISVLLLLSFLLLSFSCTGEAPAEEKPLEDYGRVKGDYLFKAASTRTAGFIPLLKYNVHNGECLPVCPDIFCAHNDENCFFYNVGIFTNIGNTLYIERLDKATGRYGIYEFNVDNGIGNFIRYNEEPMMFLTSYYRYLFYCVRNKCYRFDTESKELYTFPQTPSTYIERITNGNIYWRTDKNENGVPIYAVTDLDGNVKIEKTDNFIRFGKYYYRGEFNVGGGVIAYNMYRSEDNENWERIAEKIGMGMFLGDRIFYFDPNVKKIGKHTKLYSMAMDGTDVRLVVDDENISMEMIPSDTNMGMINGDYAGITLGPEKPIDETNENESYPECDILILNYKTGEYIISRSVYG